MLLATLSVKADNVVSVSSASGHPGDEVTLQLSLNNTDEVVAFQTEIPLGDNLTYVANSVELNADRISDHSVTAAVVGGNLRIFAYSLSLTPFVGNEGTLLSFSLKLKNEPGDNTIDATASKLSNASSVSLSFTANNGIVTILSPKLQINTCTINYGHVPIWSEYNGTAQVTNIGNEPLTLTEMNLSDAVFSCPSFAETTIQAGQSASFTIIFAPIVKGAVNAIATIVSNSMSGDGVISLVADPYAVNEVHIENTSGYCDSIVSVPLRVNNVNQLIGFQLDMELPTALEYVGLELSSRKTDHVCTGIVYNDTLRVMAYSPTGSAFTGDDGIVAYIKVRLHGRGGNYFLNPFKSVLADALGENVLSEKYQGYVNIRSPRISGNSSLDMGNSSVTETVAKKYVVRNNGNAQMRIDNVVFDQQDWAVAESFPLTVEQHANTTLHVSYNRELKGDFTATMKIYSNDPQNGLKNVALSGHRYEPNSLSIEADPFILDDGDIAVAISMDNYTDIVALQADFVYPYQDYSVAQSDFELAERIENHTLYTVATNDSTYRVMVFSMQNAEVEGNEGVVLNVTMHPIGEPVDKNYLVSAKNIVLSGHSGANELSGEDVSTSYRLTTTHSESMVAGWNWYSTYIEQDDIDGLTMLENSLGSNGVIIKSQGASIENYYSMLGYNYWYGNLSASGLHNENCYTINVTDNCNASITGKPVKPENHPITIQPNWNWIGYPVSIEQDVATAMDGFVGTQDDVIKGQGSSSTYYAGYGWYPALNLVPGHGYKYLSKANSNRILIYNFDPSKTVNLVQNTKFWKTDVSAFADNITIIAVVSINNKEVKNTDFELGAFVGDECRGSANLTYFEPLDSFYAVMTVCGDDGDDISFGIVNKNTGLTNFDCNNHVVFTADAILGSLDNPCQMGFISKSGNSVNLDIYPNPVERNASFTLDIPSDEIIDNILITNLLGCEVEYNEGISVAGIYHVRVMTKSGVIYNGKLIVK